MPVGHFVTVTRGVRPNADPPNAYDYLHHAIFRRWHAQPDFPRPTPCFVKLWIDADAAPLDVKEICFRVSERLKLVTVLVANQRLLLPAGYLHLSAVRVDGGPDVADRYIAEHATAGDVAVTADIPLAALLVPKGVAVIDPRGESYTAESIGERLSVRNFMDGLRGAGVETGGHAAYGPREKQAFANALDRALTRALRQR